MLVLQSLFAYRRWYIWSSFHELYIVFHFLPYVHTRHHSRYWYVPHIIYFIVYYTLNCFCLHLFILLNIRTDVRYEHVIMGLAAFIKFLNAVTFFTASLQGMEIYPTCMRQTGIALGTILANAIGIVAPYLVYLGTTVDIRSPYYILGTLFLLGAIGAAFLPETLHKKLPDTMEEARQFGKQEASNTKLVCCNFFVFFFFQHI